MRAAAAQALWLLANNRPITMAQCGALFLSDNSSDSAGGTSHAQRYYQDLPRAEQRGARAAQSTPGTPSHARAPTGSPSAPPSHAVAREQHGSPAASDPPRRGRRSAAQIRIARLLAGEERHRIAELADVRRTRVPAAALGDVVHVGGDDDADWVVDTAGAAGSPLVLGGGALRAARPEQRPKKRRRLSSSPTPPPVMKMNMKTTTKTKMATAPTTASLLTATRAPARTARRIRRASTTTITDLRTSHGKRTGQRRLALALTE
mmetsp:Transcript_60604/g.180248  ORF Transcript_60604/g.180248 Transcript_60604/m.180248 type:complete len:263 (+) Transcript_60604:188-976(+)